MRIITVICLSAFGVFVSCHTKSSNITEAGAKESNSKPVPALASVRLTLEQANRLLELPITCVVQQYPNKLGQTLEGANDLAEPTALHPAFYGCFDWHSAVHGHWSMVRLLKEFPNLERANEVREVLAS
ncbi:MAG: hypothetical protein RLZZ241_2392, partial [Bacteroidota bacterium]